jgi:hypothetical protein
MLAQISSTLHASTVETNPKNRGRASTRIRFPGITADAKRLGVNRVTLYKMLAGYPGFVGLKTLRRRYDRLQKRRAA